MSSPILAASTSFLARLQADRVCLSPVRTCQQQKGLGDKNNNNKKHCRENNNGKTSDLAAAFLCPSSISTKQKESGSRDVIPSQTVYFLGRGLPGPHSTESFLFCSPPHSSRVSQIHPCTHPRSMYSLINDSTQFLSLHTSYSLIPI